MKLYINITRIIFTILILLTYACIDNKGKTDSNHRKFSLNHIGKSIEFNSSLNIDSTHYPSQYVDDAIVLFDKNSSVKIYISIEKKPFVSSDINIKNSFYQSESCVYENKDSLFYNCDNDVINIKNIDIKYAHCLIKNNILDSDIKLYKLKYKESMYFFKFYLDTIYLDIYVQFNKNTLNEVMLIKQILESISIN